MLRLRKDRRRLRRGTTVLVSAALVLPLAAVATAADAPGLSATAEPAAADSAGAGYVSRPDISAPQLTTTVTGRPSPGLLMATPGFLDGSGPFGAAIYGNNGELVWWEETEPGRFYLDLEPVTFRGRPALAVFESSAGTPSRPEDGRYVILDTSYDEIASFAVRGYPTDIHDIEFSPDGSRVLLVSYDYVPYDLSPYGGPADAELINMIVQEQDVRTGRVTFEWSALDHIPVTETQESLLVPDPLLLGFDYLHINSMDYDRDGNLLLSGRHTSTVYKIDHRTGEIIWRFGGERSDFSFGDPASMPSYQHDARRLPDGRLSLFDNGNGRDPQYSRGAVYRLDERTMTAELVEDLRTEPSVFGFATGSTRELREGSHLVSYGTSGVIAEFDDGEPVLSGAFEPGVITYRAERAAWHATPDAPPDAAIGEAAGDGGRTVHMSWNGATEVRAWRIQAGPGPQHLRTMDIAPKTGFETSVEIHPPDGATVYRITALGRFGKPLGSRTLTL